jgi:hypothetical protein
MPFVEELRDWRVAGSIVVLSAATAAAIAAPSDDLLGVGARTSIFAVLGAVGVSTLSTWRLPFGLPFLHISAAVAAVGLIAAETLILVPDLGVLANDIEQSFLTALSLASITSAAALLGAVDVGRGVDRIRLRIWVVLAALWFAIWTDPTVRTVPRACRPGLLNPCSRRRGGGRPPRVGRAPRAAAVGVQPLWRVDRLTQGSYLS